MRHIAEFSKFCFTLLSERALLAVIERCLIKIQAEFQKASTMTQQNQHIVCEASSQLRLAF